MRARSVNIQLKASRASQKVYRGRAEKFACFIDEKVDESLRLDGSSCQWSSDDCIFVCSDGYALEELVCRWCRLPAQMLRQSSQQRHEAAAFNSSTGGRHRFFTGLRDHILSPAFASTRMRQALADVADGDARPRSSTRTVACCKDAQQRQAAFNSISEVFAPVFIEVDINAAGLVKTHGFHDRTIPRLRAAIFIETNSDGGARRSCARQGRVDGGGLAALDSTRVS